MAPTYATDSSEGGSGEEDEDEDGVVGGDVFQNGVKLSREEDGGRDEDMASIFRDLKMIDPRRKKIK